VPGFANATACSMVSASRISPIRMTSGAWRKVSMRMPGMRIDADFAMGDQRLLRSMHELDGIFHGDDMTRRRTVAVVDHGASDVDLPDPVAPTTSTRPRLS